MGLIYQKDFYIKVGLLFCLCSTGYAHDIFIPEWRGGDGTTFQHFSFDAESNPASPELIDNHFGTASAMILVNPPGAGWLETLPGLGSQAGIWGLGPEGTVTVDIETGFEETGPQEIWLQVTYLEGFVWSPPQINISQATFIEEQVITIEDVGLGDEWKLLQSKWLVNQGVSTIQISITADVNGSYIDQTVIDSRSTTDVCIVNLEDLMAFVSQWLLSAPNLDADLYKDDQVNYLDFQILAEYWLNLCPQNWPL